jgi:putative hydrolase of the HAD superfamily
MKIKAVFLDIGNVLLTNGWDRRLRREAAEKFGLDHEEMNERHHLTFDTYEEGKLSLEEYLTRVVFYEEPAKYRLGAGGRAPWPSQCPRFCLTS